VSDSTDPKTITVAFNDLPQPVRERLMASFTAEKPDGRLLAFEVRTQWRGFKKILRAISLVVAVICVYQVLTRAFRYTVGSSEEYQILAVALAALLWSQIRITIEKRWPPPPWREGRVALPGSIVETRGGWLHITPMSTLGKPTILTVKRNGQYQYTDLQFSPKLTFSYGKQEAAEAACIRILEAKARVSELIERRDLAALSELDPFAECTLSGTWGRPGALSIQGPTVAIAPDNVVVKWVVPIVVALAVSFGLSVYVNHYLQLEMERQEAAKRAQ
jgi:hypothetical protein